MMTQRPLFFMPERVRNTHHHEYETLTTVGTEHSWSKGLDMLLRKGAVAAHLDR